MSLLGSLQVRLGLDTATFNTKFNSFAKDLERRTTRFQKSLQGLTNIGSLLGSAGIGAAFASGINTAAQFESSMNQVGAASDATGGQITNLTGLALEFGKTSVFSANEIAAAMLDLAKAGITPEQMGTGTLAATLQLAATEGMELSRAAEVMAEQMGAFKLAASDGASIADALAGASISSTASVEGLAQALSQSAAVASLTGATLNETAGALALLAQNGIKGSDAGTSLKTMFLRLVPSTKEATNTMKALGINFTNADGSIKNITQVADILRSKLGGLTDAQRQTTLQTIFGTDAFRAAAILTKTTKGELEGYIDATKDKNAAEKLGEARVKGFAGAMLQLKNSIAATFLEMTQDNGTLSWLTTGAQKLREFVMSLSAAPPWVSKLALGLAGAAIVLPPLAFGLSAVAGVLPVFAKGIAFAFGPWGIAIAAAGAAIWHFRDDLAAAWSGISKGWKDFSSQEEGGMRGVKESASELGGTFRRMAEDVKASFISLRTTSGEAAAKSGTDSQFFANSWSQAFSGVEAGADLALRGINSAFDWLWTNAKGAGYKMAEWGDMIWTGLVKAGYKMTEWADEMINSIAEKWKNFKWSDLGDQVMNGIVEGIKSKGSAAVQAMKEMGTSIIDAAKSTLQIKSPSRVFFGIGQFVSEGFGLGIKDQLGFAQKQMNDLLGIGKASTMFAPRAIPVSERSKGGFHIPLKEHAKEFESAWGIALGNTQNAMDDLVRNGEISFKGLVNSIIADFASAQLSKAVSALFKGVSGAMSGSGGDWGTVISGVVSAFASFDGGGYTGSGPRTGGMDGKGGRLAMIHPQETVIDHTKVSRSSRAKGNGGLNLTVPITLQPGVSHEELSRLIPEVQKNIISLIPKLVQRGGRYASAFGA